MLLELSLLVMLLSEQSLVFASLIPLLLVFLMLLVLLVECFAAVFDVFTLFIFRNIVFVSHLVYQYYSFLDRLQLGLFVILIVIQTLLGPVLFRQVSPANLMTILDTDLIFYLYLLN